MNLSIIGASQILNQYHINAINALDKINLQYIFDLNYSSSLVIEKKSTGKAVKNIEDVYKSDYCFISVPPSVRKEIISNLHGSFKAVIIEKPAAMNLSEFNEIQKLSIKKGFPIYVTQSRRYFSNHVLLKNFFKSGILGKIRKIKIREGGILNWKSNSDHLSKFINETDKGILQDVGSHLLDLVNLYCRSIGIKINDCSIKVNNFDHKNLTNDLFFSINGDLEIDMGISRSKMLSNLITIYGEHGQLITRSLFDDKLILRLNEGEKTIISSLLQKKDFSIESAFIEMWKDILNINDPIVRNAATLDSVKPSIELMQKVIDEINK